MQVIVFELEGQRVVMTPNLDCGFTIEEIAEKDVPTGIEYTIIDSSEIQIDIAELRECKWSEIKAERDRLEQAGVPYLGKMIDSDMVSVQRIAIAVQAAQAAIAAEIDFSLAWTCADNTTLTMTAEQVVNMSVAIATYSNQLHQVARLLREQIEDVSTKEELDLIVWPE